MVERILFPTIDAAPYWRPITPDDLGILLKAPPEPGDLDFAEGWELALFSINQQNGPRATVWGWVRGFLGVFLAKMPAGVFGNLTHIPTGVRIGLFRDDAEAAIAADAVEPVTDWGAVTSSSARQIGPDVVGALRTAGFRRVIAFAVCVEEVETIWVRETGGAH